MAHGAGIDPNSTFMISYINSSEGRNGWDKIHEEIGSFDKIAKDKTRPRDERIDAEGYLEICRSKILGSLFQDKSGKKFEEMREKQIFSKYFGVDDATADYQKIFDATKQYAKNLVEEHRGKQTFPDQSVLNSAYAVLLKLPFYDREQGETIEQTCKEYARAHF